MVDSSNYSLRWGGISSVILRSASWLTEVAITFAASKIGVFWEVGSKYWLVGLHYFAVSTWLNWTLVWQSRWDQPFPKRNKSEGRRTIQNPSSHTAPCCQLFPQAGCSNPLEQSLYLIDQVNGTPSKREHSKLGMIVKVANLGKDGYGIINILHRPGFTKALRALMVFGGFPYILPFFGKVG